MYMVIHDLALMLVQLGNVEHGGLAHVSVLVLCHGLVGSLWPIRIGHLEQFAQRLSDGFSDLVDVDVAHRADGETADKRVRVVGVLQ